MYRITRNLWIDTVRVAARRGPHDTIDDTVLHVADNSHAAMEAHMELNDVDRAMNRLPNEQREAIALVLVEGLAYKDAAAVLDIPMGTLTSRLVRGREALIRELGEAA